MNNIDKALRSQSLYSGGEDWLKINDLLCQIAMN